MGLKRIALVLLAAFTLIGASQCSNDKAIPAGADELIDAMSQGCNLGPWSRAALARASSLETVFENIRQKAHCQGANVDSALYAAQSLQAELRAVAADDAWRKEREMEEASNDLLLSLSNPGLDPTAKDGLAGYYADARMELSMARADANFLQNPGRKSRVTTGLERISGHVRDLMSASAGLSECYANNPDVALQLGAGLAELSGAFMSPVVGLGVSTVSSLFKLGVDVANSFPSAEAIYQLRKGKMPIALSCGLEALTRDYCKAKDARTLITVAVREHGGKVLPFFRGIELQDRHLPVLYAWLDRVVNGTDDVKDPDHANRLNDQYTRIANVQNSHRYATGLFNQTKSNIDASLSNEVKIAYLRGLIRNLVGLYYTNYLPGNPDPSPGHLTLFEGFESVQDFIRTIARERVPHDPTTQNPKTFNNYSDLIDGLLLQPDDISLLKINFEMLFKSRYLEVAREFNNKVNVNLSSLVRDASRSNMEGLSPMRALEETFTFLENYRFNGSSANDAERDRILIQELLGRIRSVYEALSDPGSISDRPEEIPCDPSSGKKQTHCFGLSPAAKTLSLVFDELKLENNNVYLPGTMKGLVNTDLVNRYFANEGPKDLDEILKLAGTDLFETLQRFNLTPNQAETDIDRGQAMSSSTLKEFRDYFVPVLRDAMADLKKAADEQKEPEAGRPESPNRNVLSQLCLLTLISGQEWPKDIDPSICSGTKVVSREAKVELDFDQLRTKLEGSSFDDRACVYEEFLRTDRIANLNLELPHRPGWSFWQNLVDRLGIKF